MRLKHLLAVGILAAALGGSTAIAGGVYTNGMPLAGGTQYPSTLPLTGNEQIPADTELSSGQAPQSEAITVGQMSGSDRTFTGSGGWRNSLIGGDFGTNPWAYGTTVASTANTATYTANRWVAFSSSASGAVSVSKQTGASDITTGYQASARVSRDGGNTNTGAMCMAQEVESANSYRFQGSTAEFVSHLLAGSGFSAASSQVSMKIITGTGTDEGTASLAAGTWTGQATAVSRLTTISATWGRYSAVATIPAAATEIAVEICFTPVGTATIFDYFEFTGAQLDVNPNAVANTVMSSFERRPTGTEQALAARYYQSLAEPGKYPASLGSGGAQSTQSCFVWVALPVVMRSTPTVTTSTGTFNIIQATGTAGVAITTGNAYFGAMAVQNLQSVGVIATAAQYGIKLGGPCSLGGGGGTGYIAASAEL